MKTKGLVFVSCLAAGALITSPAIGKPAKKAAGSSSRPQRMTARTTQATDCANDTGDAELSLSAKYELAHGRRPI